MRGRKPFSLAIQQHYTTKGGNVMVMVRGCIERCMNISMTSQIRGNVHLPIVPLDFFHNIERAVQDELVQMTSLVAEAGLAVAALLGGAELVLEERIVLGADDGEVI